MKTSFTLAIVLSAIGLSGAPFQNLNFEQARTDRLEFANPSRDRGIGLVSDLLPGWEVYYTGRDSELLDLWETFKTGSKFEKFGFNVDGSMSSRSFGSLWDRTVRPPLAGNFSLFFFEVNWTLQQRGEIPADARSLSYTHLGRSFRVSIDGQEVWPPDGIALPSFDGPVTVSFDVSAYAGRTVDLAFHTTGGMPFGDSEFGSLIDSITFSIPEPSTYALRRSARACSAVNAGGSGEREPLIEQSCAGESSGRKVLTRKPKLVGASRCDDPAPKRRGMSLFDGLLRTFSFRPLNAGGAVAARRPYPFPKCNLGFPVHPARRAKDVLQRASAGPRF